MKLFRLHDTPNSLDHHGDEDLVPELAWEKYKNNPEELKKREKTLARDPETAYKYAQHVLKGPFPLGEPSIAKDAWLSFFYADIIKGPFKLGEPTIKKSRYMWSTYNSFIATLKNDSKKSP